MPFRVDSGCIITFRLVDTKAGLESYRQNAYRSGIFNIWPKRINLKTDFQLDIPWKLGVHNLHILNPFRTRRSLVAIFTSLDIHLQSAYMCGPGQIILHSRSLTSQTRSHLSTTYIEAPTTGIVQRFAGPKPVIL